MLNEYYLDKYFNIVIVLFISIAICTVLVAIANWKIYNKAGLHGWASIIPLYSQYTRFKLAYSNGWKAALMFIPIVWIYFSLECEIKLAKCFGRGIMFAYLSLMFNPIPYLILGFNKDEYEGPLLDSEEFSYSEYTKVKPIEVIKLFLLLLFTLIAMFGLSILIGYYLEI